MGTVLGVRLRSLAAAPLAGLIAFAPFADASPTQSCGSVSYTFPHTHDEGHAALNNLRASEISCTTARAAARTFLITGKAPASWHASLRTVVIRTNGKANTVSEEILTDGLARVTGDIAN